MRIEDYLLELEAPKGEVCGLPTEEVEEPTEGEDDFWEALDLLASARRQLLAILNRCEDLSVGRRKNATTLCGDIKDYLDQFVDEVVLTLDEKGGDS